jgi:hypothetical protein
LTYGERLGLGKADTAAVTITKATADAIDGSKLSRYRHLEQLAEECRNAVRALDREPWPFPAEEGIARIMGAVMDAMQKRDLPVPAVWYPILKENREMAKMSPDEQEKYYAETIAPRERR